MHSRIFEISSQPIPQSEYMNEYYFDEDHHFYHCGADFVREDVDRHSSIEWFKDSLIVGDGLASFEEESFLLHEGFQAAYWDGRYCAFIREVDKLRSLTANEFAQGDAAMPLYRAGQLHDEELGFYVVFRDEERLMTMDEFIRSTAVETRYYIGGTVDYHA